VTERERDIDDIANIIRAGGIDWSKLIEIALSVTESELDSRGVKGVVLIYEVFVSLERVNERYPGLVSQSTLRRVEKEAEKYYKAWLELLSESHRRDEK